MVRRCEAVRSMQFVIEWEGNGRAEKIMRD